MNPCPNSPDKKHNVAHPDYPCIYGCGFGGKKLKPILEGIDYRPVKEKGIVTQAYEFFGKQIPYPRLAMIKKKIGDQAFREYLSCSKHDKPKNPIAYFLWATSDNIKKTWAAEKETNINPNHPPYKGYKNMKEEVKISQKTLEDLSLKALAQIGRHT